jgi:hypothetical protein
MSLESDITTVINMHSLENTSNTPDFLLAEFMLACLYAYNTTLQKRTLWYGRMDESGSTAVVEPPESW